MADTNEGKAVEITRGINLAVTVGGFALTIGTMLVGGTWGYATLAASNEDNARRVAIMEEKTKALDTYMFRQGQVETSVVEANKRIDRVVESFNGKVDAVLAGIDSIKDDVAGVKSDVRVMAQKVGVRVEPTGFKP